MNTKNFGRKKTSRHFPAVWVGVCLSLWAVGASPAVTFNFDYSQDAANEGFNDPTLGASRRAAMQQAGDIWGGFLTSRYVGETINVRVAFNPLGSTNLGSLGVPQIFRDFASTSSKYQGSTWYVPALANHLAGSDLDPSSFDLNGAFNSDVDGPTALGATSFYYGLDANPGSDIDFVSVALREIARGLGFFSSMSPTGTYQSGFSSIYDRYLYRGSTPGIPGNFVTAHNTSGRAADVISGDLYWNGPAGTLANAGNLIELFAPNPYQSGKSVIRLDATEYPTDLLSVVSIETPGYVNQTPSARDLGILSDIGWEVVPEPGTLSLLALASLAWAGRRRRPAA